MNIEEGGEKHLAGMEGDKSREVQHPSSRKDWSWRQEQKRTDGTGGDTEAGWGARVKGRWESKLDRINVLGSARGAMKWFNAEGSDLFVFGCSSGEKPVIRYRSLCASIYCCMNKVCSSNLQNWQKNSIREIVSIDPSVFFSRRRSFSSNSKVLASRSFWFSASSPWAVFSNNVVSDPRATRNAFRSHWTPTSIRSGSAESWF